MDREALGKAEVRRVISLPTRPFPLRLGVGVISAALGLFLSVLLALWALLRFKPCCLLSLGSHVGFPAGLAARFLGIPVVVHEQNVLPGRAVRILARMAHTIAVTYPATLRLFPYKPRRAIVTGMPVRREIIEADKEEARRRLGIDKGALFLLAFGGSLGARRINEALLGAWPTLEREVPRLKVTLVAGSEFYRVVHQRIPCSERFEVVRYAHHFPLLLAASDLVISRAGASTVAELSSRGLPAILVPYPLAAMGHQRTNALYLSRRGAAVAIEDGELTPKRLVEEIKKLALSGAKRHNMAQAAKDAFLSGAAERIARVMLEICCRQERKR